MSDESKSDIDPRFNPAFQRGYQPSEAPAAEPKTPRAVPPAPRVVQAPPVETVVSAPPAVQLHAEEPVKAPVTDAATARNPFLVALGVVAVVLVGVGILLFQQSSASFNSKAVRSQGDYMALGATIQFAPFISLLGVATAIAVVFVFALRWRR